MTQKQTDPAASTPAAGPETPKHTDAQLDAARNEARADGHQAGRAEGEKEGRKAERTRLAAILAHAEAKDRQPLALSIATETDMDVEQAGKVLAAAPKQAQPNALAAVMAGIQNPNVGTDPSADIESEERLARVIAGVKPEASAAH